MASWALTDAACHIIGRAEPRKLAGLFGRGLPTKVASSGLQGAARNSENA